MKPNVWTLELLTLSFGRHEKGKIIDKHIKATPIQKIFVPLVKGI